jgi:chromosome segregation ATPase
MKQEDFLKLKGIGFKDTITVNALELQALLQEVKDKDEMIEMLSDSNKKLLEEKESMEVRLNKALDHNDELYDTVIKQSSKITELRQIMESTNERLSKALYKAKDAEQLKDKLGVANALMEYRRNQNMIDRLTDPLHVELRR